MIGDTNFIYVVDIIYIQNLSAKLIFFNTFFRYFYRFFLPNEKEKSKLYFLNFTTVTHRFFFIGS